jgi:hypothetical protein
LPRVTADGEEEDLGGTSIAYVPYLDLPYYHQTLEIKNLWSHFSAGIADVSPETSTIRLTCGMEVKGEIDLPSSAYSGAASMLVVGLRVRSVFGEQSRCGLVTFDGAAYMAVLIHKY